jgi:hypothetical protein
MDYLQAELGAGLEPGNRLYRGAGLGAGLGPEWTVVTWEPGWEQGSDRIRCTCIYGELGSDPMYF